MEQQFRLVLPLGCKALQPSQRQRVNAVMVNRGGHQARVMDDALTGNGEASD
ncbi:hypothetical protein PI93_015735 [Pandoraea fibrosis]|uniref:Uncharacterized protein n=1 Tax=Pandoraea fibrosis TaxID=1891094 RepID=A0ABX6HTV8_9BURK|nr:hypothetical protein [Pandoraea fibrosis]QHE92514.1 hypothetical protein PJ20_012265 [Pandoraea fibrosis]QHF13930.1 hypothetical protein PI93_015735 [Pandoraea fibrosis]